jgi:dihydropteroate synthase
MTVLSSSNFDQRYFKPRIWSLAHGRCLTLGPKSVLMGILNITPDSFSDGGQLPDIQSVLSAADKMISQGADILDIGGESTRPGADPVTAQQEQGRVLPVIEALSARFDVLLSIDTYRARTAELAILSGAHIINDVWGLQKEPKIANVAAKTSAGICIMHTGRDRKRHKDVITDQLNWFGTSLGIADEAGVKKDAVVLDPGFGFAKETLEENLSLMLRFDELHSLGYPILAGTSRKRFIGALTGRQEAFERDAGTAVTSAVLRQMGAALFRVHDVGMNKDALSIVDGLISHHLSKGI